MILSITEGQLNNPIRPNLPHARHPPRLQQLPQLPHEPRGVARRRARKVGQVAPEPGVYDELLLDVGLGELEEQDAGRELVDVGDAERDDALGELVRDCLAGELVLAAAPGGGRGQRGGRP